MVRPSRLPFSSARPFVLALVLTTVFALLSAGQGATYLSYAAKPIPWAGMVKSRLIDWYLYALFVPFLYGVAVRRVRTRSWAATLLVYLAAGLLCALAKEALFTAVANWIRPEIISFPQALAENYLQASVLFWTAIAALHVYAARQEPRTPNEPALIERFVVNGAKGYRVIPVDQVEWIDADGNYAGLNTGKGRHLVRATMASLESGLGARFVRIHRGAIVNRAHVAGIQPRSHGAYAVLLSSGAEVVSSRSYNANLRALIG